MNLKDEIALEMIIEIMHRLYGYDFRHYSKASLKRRILYHQTQNNIPTLPDFIPLLLNDSDFFQKLLISLSVTVTEMFRDPGFYKEFSNLLLPKLKTYPYTKIWHAGCATGEEVYSMAILLFEHEQLDRTQIYATDFNPSALSTAIKGIYSDKHYGSIFDNYKLSGGKAHIDDYIVKMYDAIKIKKFLKKNMTFHQHNLSCDGSIGEMQVIICRNVLIYFDQILKQKVATLFSNSLSDYGFLCLGSQETIHHPSFKCLDKKESIYQKVPV